MSFSVISQNFLFFGWVSKIPFFDNLAQKTRTLKHYKNRCFSKLFLKKKHMRHETAIFGPKNQSSEIPVIIFLPVFLFQQQKTPKIAETLIFIVF